MDTCTANSIADMTLKTVLKLNTALQRPSKVRFLKILGKQNKKKRVSVVVYQGQGHDKIAGQIYFTWDQSPVPTRG